VLTAPVLAEPQQLLDEGLEPSEVADRLGIKRDTFSKAVRAGRLHKAAKNDLELASKSERSAAERTAAIGVGAVDVVGPLAARVGELDAVAPDFTPALDVPNGGLLCALPALLAVGLKGVERYLSLPKGDYGLDSLCPRLAFMALARFESIESLRDSASGEWGKLLGLDRVAEVRILRAKIQLLAQEDAPGQWSAALYERWMAAAPEHSGVLYIDGHVRVYNGRQTQLPRHYVARQRLRLRALCTSEADRIPDPEAGTLTVRLHHSANVATDQVIEKLCEEPNATETVFPRTNLRLVLKTGST
jgi:hypothetical protein